MPDVMGMKPLVGLLVLGRDLSGTAFAASHAGTAVQSQKVRPASARFASIRVESFTFPGDMWAECSVIP